MLNSCQHAANSNLHFGTFWGFLFPIFLIRGRLNLQMLNAGIQMAGGISKMLFKNV